MSIQMYKDLEIIANSLSASSSSSSSSSNNTTSTKSRHNLTFFKEVIGNRPQIQPKFDSNANRVHPYQSKTIRDSNYQIESVYVSDKELEIQLQQKLSNENEKTKPDHDTIKMFVGQLPKAMTESDLKKIFEEYGRVYQVNLLRDPGTGISRGCCFVTYYTRKAALKAQDALHNLKTLNGMHNPIQMRPAVSENRSERKLFVGMLSKKYVENDVRALFSSFGLIEECTVLRNPSGQSRGCAFVTFGSKQSALSAIKGLHHSQTMDGCSSPLVVKFADTQKEKDQKKLHQIQTNLWNGALAAASTPVQPPTVAATVAAAAHQPQFMPSTASLLPPPITNDAFQFLQNAMNNGEASSGNAGLQLLSTDNLLAAAAAAPLNLQNLMNFAAFNNSTAATTLASNSLFLQNSAKTTTTLPCPNPLSSVSNTLTDLTSNALYGSIFNTNSTPTSIASTAAAAAAATTSVLPPNIASIANVAGKQIEGPEGCNLFIYHIPPEFTDIDLASTFIPFGNVLSAKVFIDKQTKLSKCFGFVSYDNVASAQAAIKTMDHFQIGTKHLKVQLKRQKNMSSSLCASSCVSLSSSPSALSSSSSSSSSTSTTMNLHIS